MVSSRRCPLGPRMTPGMSSLDSMLNLVRARGIEPAPTRALPNPCKPAIGYGILLT